MFNFFFTNPTLFGWLCLPFFIFFSFRNIFIRRWTLVLIYHLSLFSTLLILSLGGGGVQNDGYKRLELFISLEENNQLQDAKNNPQKYDGMFQIDLMQFQNSAEFRTYLQENDLAVDRIEALFLAWLIALMADLSIALAWLVQRKNFVHTNYNKY